MAIEEKNSRTDLPYVLFRYIRLDPDNKRFDLGDIDKLREQIRRHGVKDPVRGYVKKEDGVEYYYITDGKRRFHACQMLMEEGIEVKVPFHREKQNTNREQRAIERIIYNDGKAYNPLELALEVRQLEDWGWEQPKIAESLGFTENYVRKLILLSNAPMTLQNLVREKIITGTLAITAMEKKLVDKVIERAKKVKVALSEQEEVDSVLAQMGLFSPSEVPLTSSPALNSELPKTSPATPPSSVPSRPSSRITRQDIVLNSWKLLKDHMKTANPVLISPQRKYVYDFLSRVISNEATIDDIEMFFTPPPPLDRSGSVSEYPS